MNHDMILFIFLCVWFIGNLTTGICLKKYTKRRLNDIDAFQGIIKKKDCLKNPVVIQIDVSDDKKRY